MKWRFWKKQPSKMIRYVDIHKLKPGTIIPHAHNEVIVTDSGMGNLKPGQKITVGKINGKRPKRVSINGKKVK